MDKLLSTYSLEKLRELFNLENVADTTIILFLTIVGVVLIFFVLLPFFKFSNRKNKVNSSINKPSLNDFIIKDNQPTVTKDNENDFIDVLVAIEEEMAAIRELYVGGYITKGIYISETDRLYEKARIFGL